MEKFEFLLVLVSLGIGLFLVLFPINLLFVLRDKLIGDGERAFSIFSTIVLELVGGIIIYYSLTFLPPV